MGALFGLRSQMDAARQNETAKKSIAEIEKQIADLNKSGEDVEQELGPEERARLIAAHKLVANRSFGWSKLFADLEGVMPGRVSASRIAVENIFMDGDRIKAELDFAVLSKDDASVFQMIDNMNNSGVFRAELRGTDLQKTDRLTFTEHTLHLVYSPNYPAPVSTSDPLYTQNQEAPADGR